MVQRRRERRRLLSAHTTLFEQTSRRSVSFSSAKSEAAHRYCALRGGIERSLNARCGREVGTRLRARDQRRRACVGSDLAGVHRTGKKPRAVLRAHRTCRRTFATNLGSPFDATDLSSSVTFAKSCGGKDRGERGVRAGLGRSWDDQERTDGWRK